ncbi:hypothetical protein V3H18_14510 [Methylocystis sp. 9N]|uniref:Uncharacterized protein n=1 Tax=Methylocystis borbori TaxID=3118750 RepID=A0ABU7XK40_9HYPH
MASVAVLGATVFAFSVILPAVVFAALAAAATFAGRLAVVWAARDFALAAFPAAALPADLTLRAAAAAVVRRLAAVTDLADARAALFVAVLDLEFVAWGF